MLGRGQRLRSHIKGTAIMMPPRSEVPAFVAWLTWPTMLLSATARRRALLLFGYGNARLPIRGSAHPMTPEVVPPDLTTPLLQACDRSHANVRGGLHGEHGVRGHTVAPTFVGRCPLSVVCAAGRKKRSASACGGACTGVLVLVHTVQPHDIIMQVSFLCSLHMKL